MPAEISGIEIDGRNIVEAMYAETPAWHNLGVVLPEAVPSGEAMTASHTDWLVEKEPMKLVKDDEVVNEYFAIVRQDTRKTLSVVGKKYRPLQNIQAFNFLDSLMMDGIIKYEAAFALKGGKHVCLLARMPSVDTVVKGDHQLRYVFFNNTHGGGGIQITPTSVRVVCANTKRMAIGEGRKAQTLVSIRHTGDLDEKLNTALKFLSQFDQAFTNYKVDAQKLLKGFTVGQKIDYIESLFPSPDKDATDRVKNGHKRKVEQVEKSLLSPAQNIVGVKGTWWSLFNAITEAVDHGDKLRKISDLAASRENRFLDVVSGPGANFKDQAFALALDLAV
jgi:phage/plasmid-like protein (TIGR03299 family)